MSSVGKGLISASLSSILEARGFKVSVIKCDPYINVDPGTLSPFQHGEVYVTSDGAETDLDLGHYERFTSLALSRDHSITTGQVYQTVINKERRGDYLGRTVQVIPHITDEIKKRIFQGSKDADITVVEIGGTVGDIEGLPFIEAIRQIRIEQGPEQAFFAHVTFVPYIPAVGELKSKPSQHSVKALREVGIQPDFLICRSSMEIDSSLKKKLALFSNLEEESVIPVPDASSIYEIPLLLTSEKMDDKLMNRMGLKGRKKADLSRWKDIVQKIKNPKQEISVGLVGKYVHLRDSYQSIHEALCHGGIPNQTKVNIKYINSEKNLSDQDLKDLDGILVPGGFGDRGADGKIEAIKYCRINEVPFFGICLGMQMAAVEFGRNVCNLEASSREFLNGSKGKEDLVIDFMPGQENMKEMGGSMRLGSYPCLLSKDSRSRKIYTKDLVEERHRHRFEFNMDYAKKFEEKGMKIAGVCKDNDKLVEILEIPDHPWFIGSQFHPEFQSKPHNPHPLFVSFISACLKKKQESVSQT